MSCTTPTRTVARRRRATVLAALTIAVAVVAAVLHALLADQPSTASPPSGAPDAQLRVAAAPRADAAPADAPPVDNPGSAGADGEVPDGTTVFDDVPAVARLDADLLDAVRRAATDAADEGVTFYVNSGWRSRAYQDQLLRDAVAQYGSASEAARWVATADTSPHVQGHAIDVGRWAATSWLSEHGAGYGLCQIYGNEPWHYELRPEAVVGGCPAMYADPTHDPRMQP